MTFHLINNKSSVSNLGALFFYLPLINYMGKYFYLDFISISVLLVLKLYSMIALIAK